MTFLTRFVDAATKLTSEGSGGVGDVLNLEGRDNDASGPAVEVVSDEEENQVKRDFTLENNFFSILFKDSRVLTDVRSLICHSESARIRNGLNTILTLRAMFQNYKFCCRARGTSSNRL